MKTLLLAVALMAAATPALAHGPGHPGGGPGHPGLPGPPGHGPGHPHADALAGLWRTDIHVSPAGCTPGAPLPPLAGRNTMVFHADGTLVENPQVTPPGVPGAVQVRSFGLGKWSYDHRAGRYRALVRFDWYAASDGLYLGYQEVDRTIQLSHDRNRASGPVTSTRYDPDGNVVARVCGEGISTRL